MSKIPISIQLYRVRTRSVSWIINELIDAIVERDAEICRICRLGDSDSNKLIVCPCACTGSIGHIHIDCHRHWRKVTGRHICEICRHVFRRVGTDQTTWQIAVLRAQRLLSSNYSMEILRRVVCSMSTIPLIRHNIHDVFNAVDAMDLFEFTTAEMAIFTYLLLSSDILFTTYLLWTVENVSWLDKLVKSWWNDIDDESFESMSISRDSSYDSFFDAFIYL